MSREVVQLEGVDLMHGQTVYIDCPWCQRKGKFGLTRNSEGLLYNCFSANCGEKGFIPDYGMSGSEYRPQPRKFTRWTGKSAPLEQEDVDFFQLRFGIDASQLGWRYTDGGKYLFPIRNWKAKWIGEVLRAPVWSGKPAPPRECLWSGQKALTYIEQDEPKLDWCLGSISTIVVLCEDQISANKVTQVTGFQGVAILGNTIGLAEVGDIAQSRPEQVIIWLDPDMSDQAFKLNAKFGSTMALPGRSTVIFSEKDPKDHSFSEIQEILR